jgi:hypothetical protein
MERGLGIPSRSALFKTVEDVDTSRKRKDRR